MVGKRTCPATAFQSVRLPMREKAVVAFSQSIQLGISWPARHDNCAPLITSVSRQKGCPSSRRLILELNHLNIVIAVSSVAGLAGNTTLANADSIDRGFLSNPRSETGDTLKFDRNSPISARSELGRQAAARLASGSQKPCCSREWRARREDAARRCSSDVIPEQAATRDPSRDTEYSVRYVQNPHGCERTRRLPGGEERMLPAVAPQRARRVVRRRGSRDFARRR